MPKVTVAIPTYNNSKTLERAITSVYRQTFTDYEILVVDDGSTDDAGKVIQDLKKRYPSKPISVLRHKNNIGRSAARNTAIAHARGKFIAWLDADDEWIPEKLEKQLQMIESSATSYKAVICGYFHNIPEKPSKIVLPNHEQVPWEIYCLEHFNLALGITLLVHAKAYEIIGNYDVNLSRGEDLDWILRYLDNYDLALVPQPLAIYHQAKSVNAAEMETAMVPFTEKHTSTYAKHKNKGQQALAARWRYLARLFLFQEKDPNQALKYFKKTYQIYPWQNPKTGLLTIFAWMRTYVDKVRKYKQPHPSLPLRVAILGIYPPPYGGVSVHCERLSAKLRTKNGIDITFFDMLPEQAPEHDGWYKPINNRVRWSLKMLLGNKEHDLIHYHGTNPFSFTLKVLALINLFRSPVVVTFHSMRYDLKPVFRRWLSKIVLKSFPAIICINNEIKLNLQDFGLKDEQLHVISPYLAPLNIDEMVVDDEAIRFIQTRSPNLIANVTRFAFHNGADLYGTDMYIELAAFLKQEYPDLGFLIVVSTIDNQAYFQSLQERVKQLGLEKNLLFFSRPGELYPLIARANVLVRATNSDSFGMSVAEAIELGVAAVASDVTSRPDGTILFRSRNQEDLNNTVLETLSNIILDKIPLAPKHINDITINCMLDIYKLCVTKN